MSWEEATKIWAELTGPDDGFYLSLQVTLLLFSMYSLALECSFIVSVVFDPEPVIHLLVSSILAVC